MQADFRIYAYIILILASILEKVLAQAPMFRKPIGVITFLAAILVNRNTRTLSRGCKTIDQMAWSIVPDRNRFFSSTAVNFKI